MPIEAYDRGLQHARRRAPAQHLAPPRRHARSRRCPAASASPCSRRRSSSAGRPGSSPSLIVFVADLPDVNTRFEPWLLIGTMRADRRCSRSTCPSSGPCVLPRLRRFFATPENIRRPRRRPHRPRALDDGRVPQRRLGQPVLPLRADRAPHPGVLPHVPRRPRARRRLHGRPTSSASSTSARASYGALEGHEPQQLHRRDDDAAARRARPELPGQRAARAGRGAPDAVEALGDSDLLFRVARSFLEGGRELDEALPNVADGRRCESSRFDRVMLLDPDDDGAGGETRVYGADVADPPEPADARGGVRRRRRAHVRRSTRCRRRCATRSTTARGPASCRCAPPDAVEGWLRRRHARPPGVDPPRGAPARRDRRPGRARRAQHPPHRRASRELAAEGERVRIAREIHDGIAQMVYMLSLSLETAIDRVGGDPEEQRQRLQDLTGAREERALGSAAVHLRPAAAAQRRRGPRRRRAGPGEGVPGRLRPARRAARHRRRRATCRSRRAPRSTASCRRGWATSSATRARRRSRSRWRSRTDTVTLAIADDGVGIGERSRAARVGFGMGNLRQRVEDLRWHAARAAAQPGEGTRIEVSVPVTEGAERHEDAADDRR